MVPLVLCALLLALAAPAIAGVAQYQKVDELGNPIGPMTDFDPAATHQVSRIAVLICSGVTAFIAYEYYRREVLGIYVLEGSERGDLPVDRAFRAPAVLLDLYRTAHGPRCLFLVALFFQIDWEIQDPRIVSRTFVPHEFTRRGLRCESQPFEGSRVSASAELKPRNGGDTPLATGVNRWNLGRKGSASPQRGRHSSAGAKCRNRTAFEERNLT